MAMLIFLVLLVVGALCMGIGYFGGKQDRIPNRERRQLVAAEELIDTIHNRAIEGLSSGESTPEIILNEFRSYKEEKK